MLVVVSNSDFPPRHNDSLCSLLLSDGDKQYLDVIEMERLDLGLIAPKQLKGRWLKSNCLEAEASGEILRALMEVLTLLASGEILRALMEALTLLLLIYLTIILHLLWILLRFLTLEKKFYKSYKVLIFAYLKKSTL